MKLRIMGSPDLERAWAAQLETHFGIRGRVYPNRNSADIRYYLDLDDRVAAEVMRSVGTAFRALDEGPGGRRGVTEHG